MCQPMHVLMAKPKSREKKKKKKKAQLFKALEILGLEITSSHLFAKISKSPVQI